MNTNKPYYVYIIICDEGKIYIGLSEDIEKRIGQHNSGKSKWTSKYSNWRQVYKKKFENLTDARKWENYLKSQKGGNGIKKILAEK